MHHQHTVLVPVLRGVGLIFAPQGGGPGLAQLDLTVVSVRPTSESHWFISLCQGPIQNDCMPGPGHRHARPRRLPVWSAVAGRGEVVAAHSGPRRPTAGRGDEWGRGARPGRVPPRAHTLRGSVWRLDKAGKLNLNCTGARWKDSLVQCHWSHWSHWSHFVRPYARAACRSTGVVL